MERDDDNAAARAGGASDAHVDLVIVTRTRELADGFDVRRALPSARRRMVGPFIFLDQMGPTVLRAGQGLDVGPHPHIGLATVTYLFAGELLHRDSLDTIQPIHPGEVNWMIAGRGIAHSERTPAHRRTAGEQLFGIQCWLALPEKHEETEPRFAHHGARELPTLDGDGVEARVIAGSLWGKRSPVEVFSDLFYADVRLEPGAVLGVPAEHEERAIYLAEGRLRIAGEAYEAGQLILLRPGAAIDVAAEVPTRALLLGGEPMDGPRHIWWNFVSSSKDRIEQAKADWREDRFGRVPEETERIPLPEGPPPPVRYP